MLEGVQRVVVNEDIDRPLRRQKVRGMLDLVRSRGEKVVPLCGFVRRYISLNPDYAGLVK